MDIQSATLGTMEVREEEVIRFEQGLPGFEHLVRFVLAEVGEGLPFYLLQSLEEANISFLIVDPFLYYPEYEVVLTASLQEELGIKDHTMAAIMCIVTTPADVLQSTVNLQAPLIMNTEQRLGRQYIMNGTDYHTRHVLIRSQSADSAETGGDAHAGTVTQD